MESEGHSPRHAGTYWYSSQLMRLRRTTFCERGLLGVSSLQSSAHGSSSIMVVSRRSSLTAHAAPPAVWRACQSEVRLAVLGRDVWTHSRPSIKTVFCMPEVGIGVHASDLMAVDLRDAVRVDASDV